MRPLEKGRVVTISAQFSKADFRNRVVYDAVDVKGFFVDATDSGDPPDSKILGYGWIWPGPVICASIQNTKTGDITEYVWDFDARRPRPIDDSLPPPPRSSGSVPPTPTAEISVPPESVAPKPRKSGSRLDRATKAWHHRYD